MFQRNKESFDSYWLTNPLAGASFYHRASFLGTSWDEFGSLKQNQDHLSRVRVKWTQLEAEADICDTASRLESTATRRWTNDILVSFTESCFSDSFSRKDAIAKLRRRKKKVASFYGTQRVGWGLFYVGQGSVL